MCHTQVSSIAVGGYFHRDTPSANSGSKFSRLHDDNDRVSRVSRIPRKSNRIQLIEEFLLFIHTYLEVSLFFHKTCNFSRKNRSQIRRGRIRRRAIHRQRRDHSRASCLRIVRDRYIYTPAAHEASEERTHALSASSFVRRRALRRCTVTQRAPLGNMR